MRYCQHSMTCSHKVEGSSKLCFCEFWKCFWMECIPSLDCKLIRAVLKTCFLSCMNKQEQEGLPTSMFTLILWTFVGLYFKTWNPYWTIWPGPLRSKFAKSEKIIGICSHWPSSTLHPAFNRDIGHTDYHPLMIGICSQVLTRNDPSKVFIKIRRRSTSQTYTLGCSNNYHASLYDTIYFKNCWDIDAGLKIFFVWSDHGGAGGPRLTALL